MGSINVPIVLQLVVGGANRQTLVYLTHTRCFESLAQTAR